MTSLAALGPPALPHPLSWGQKGISSCTPPPHPQADTVAESKVCPRISPEQESGATWLHPGHWPSQSTGVLPLLRAVSRRGHQPLYSPRLAPPGVRVCPPTPLLSSALHSGREVGPSMRDGQGRVLHAQLGASSMHVPGQVPSGKRKFGYADLRMQSSRLGAWCCLFFQGLYRLWQDAQDPRRRAGAALIPRLY